MTGDSLYPGLLTVEKIDVFTASSQRLTDFVREHPVAHVLGTHIEQKDLPYLDFGRGTIHQIDEAPLELKRAHVFELNDAFISMHGENKTVAMPDFTLVPRGTADTLYPPELRAKPK
jgi:hydroxyacylglutathione hydrolase